MSDHLFGDRVTLVNQLLQDPGHGRHVVEHQEISDQVVIADDFALFRAAVFTNDPFTPEGHPLQVPSLRRVRGVFFTDTNQFFTHAMLNIKNPETEAAVRELAGRLGASLTEAVAVAVRHELQRLEDDRNVYMRRVREAAAQVRAASAPPTWLTDADLYDEAGLSQ